MASFPFPDTTNPDMRCFKGKTDSRARARFRREREREVTTCKECRIQNTLHPPSRNPKTHQLEDAIALHFRSRKGIFLGKENENNPRLLK
jgi:hypothetical protein